MLEPRSRQVTRIPRDLIEALVTRKCVLFAGSGVSTAVGLPSWEKILSHIHDELVSEGQLPRMITESKKFLRAGKFLELADCFYEVAGKGRLYDILNEKIDGNSIKLSKLAVQSTLVALPFAGIVTTNYDNLIERAWWDRTGTQLPMFTNLQTKELAKAIYQRQLYLFKAHGDLGQSESIVFAARDYQKLVHSNPGFRAIFSSILVNYCVVFVGYSLTDPDFRLMLEKNTAIFEGFSPRHFALMRKPGRMEIDLMKRRYGITVIGYSDHSHLLPRLEALQQEFTHSTQSRDPLSD